MCKYELEIDYEAVYNNGTVVGFLETETCGCCGEKYVTDIYSNGNYDLEDLAEEFGFRDVL